MLHATPAHAGASCHSFLQESIHLSLPDVFLAIEHAMVELDCGIIHDWILYPITQCILQLVLQALVGTGRPCSL